MTSTVARGRLAESLAASFLRLRGYTIRDQNVRLGPLEIDLVAEREDILAVVEVKFRQKTSWGGASGAVNPAKVRHLETAAVRYIRWRGIRERKIRFDVVLIEAGAETDTLTLRHLAGAFPATGRYSL
jgi:putative endonuclease